MSRSDKKFDSQESNRMWASASFVGVLIIIGLPLWWKTTEVYRVPLPFDEIASFEPETQVVSTHLTVLAVDAPTADKIAGSIELAFRDSDVLRVSVGKGVLTEAQRHTLAAADAEEALQTLGLDLERENHLYVVQRPQKDRVWLGDQRALFFTDVEAAPVLTRVLHAWVLGEATLRAARGGRRAGAGPRVRLAPASGYHVVLSVVPAPGLVFDARAAVEDYLAPFTEELRELHNFTLKSQWLHLVDFDFQAKEVKDTSEYGRHFAVGAERLSQLLTSVEGRAATRVADRPAVNLVLYAAPCRRAPLRLLDQNDKPIPAPIPAFLSPKWGGVVLVSPPAAACRGALGGGGTPGARGAGETPPWSPDVPLVMGAMIAQLRPLLGIDDKEPIEGAALAGGGAARAWERDGAMRARTLEHCADAADTLRSLAQLLDEISNIVITDEVGASIRGAVARLAAARGALGGAGGALGGAGALRGAHAASLEAYLQAEAAFTDPSLLALLYFPDDQKYAIYIPLFLPVMFPVVLSLRGLARWALRRPRLTADE